jgi:hypothetical protein
MQILNGKSFVRIGTVVGLVCCTASCQSVDQGYWTKPDVSHALANEQYPDDSRQCDWLRSQSGNRLSEESKSTLYAKCMQSRGYQWIEEAPRSHPVKSATHSATEKQPCPTGRRIIDAYGYDRCVPAGGKGSGKTIQPSERVAQVTEESSTAPTSAGGPTDPSEQELEEWVKEDGLCRQHARDTLSSPYGVYVQCMQGKGWPSGTR